MKKPGEPGFVRVTIKVPNGTDGAAQLARLFRRVREAAVLGDVKLSEWITQAIIEKRDRMIVEGAWDGERGATERPEGCDDSDIRGGTGEGGGT